MTNVNYNERSWAIDVISEINLFLNTKQWYFQSAGGENTIKTNKSTLFPDVLLFKDQAKNVIIQGWELKMPDTAINNPDLIHNAIKKAKILQRDSFIVWNVKSAVLYCRNGSKFEILKTWGDININSRIEVKPKEQLWKVLLRNMLEDLNTYFQEGRINEVSPREILSIDEIIDVVLENTASTADTIKSHSRRNAVLDAEINNWWHSSSNEYGFKPTQNQDKFTTLSMVVLTDWVFKIVFAHILKRHFNEARTIDNIQYLTPIDDALNIIVSISESCNFWTILSPNLAQKYISQTAWEQITELTQFLSTINIDAIDIDILHQLLQNAVTSSKRKIAGQFATPKKLADLLTRLTIHDKTKIVLDPCCGTGTIINQVYQLKEEYELNRHEILNTIWASDKHSFPIQLSTISMAKPANIGEILNIFSADVIDLDKGESIAFKNPSNGELVEKNFPEIDYIVSNLPFIKNRAIQSLNPNIFTINDWIKEQTGTSQSLSGKSDIFAYIPFYLHRILSEDGKIGLILSNAWLGTDYGEIFQVLFQSFFDIDYILISGNGKWFDNADVVTTMLVASKKNPKVATDENREISFCTLKNQLEEIADIKTLSSHIILGSQSNNVIINRYSIKQINAIRNFGIPWSAYFSNLNWIVEIADKFIDTNEIFDFIRGERRGWNALFYPAQGHPIENIYIKPVLKNLKNTLNLECVANTEAFCCSKSIAELEELEHTGALEWIRSFESQRNGKNRPLPEVLARSNMYWYEMTTENMADFVANINYHRSLFIAKFDVRTFIDQRMIGFSIKEDFQAENKDLYLALLNSMLSMFLIESLGFGRGLGALDLRATKFSNDFKMLNPNLLTEEQKSEIIELFNPIKSRNRLPLEEEIKANDRTIFERRLLEIYNISAFYEPIKNALLLLYKIRFAVNP